MTAVPVLALLTIAVVLGVVNLVLRFRKQRKAMLIGAHLLFGIGALEILVFFLKDANSGEGVPAGAFGNAAAGLLAAALFIGLVSPVIGKHNPKLSSLLLVAHVVCGACGAATVLAWVSGR